MSMAVHPSDAAENRIPTGLTCRPTKRPTSKHFMTGRGILPCIKDIAYHCKIPETFIFKYDMGEIGFPAGNVRGIVFFLAADKEQDRGRRNSSRLMILFFN